MARVLAGIVVAAVALSACGTGSASDAPPEAIPLTTLTPVAAPAPTTVPALAPKAPIGNALPVPPPTTTPPLPTTTLPEPPPSFEYAISPVTAEEVSESWREGCPLHWENLSLLTMSYWNFAGRPVKGRMVINSSIAEDVVSIFEKLFAMKFPIERMALVDDYGGDDRAAMRANVTSGFNCRYVDGTERWSNHAFGLAIDINPLINPWARDGNVLPLEGTVYAHNRENPVPGMINLGDRIVAIFEQAGWSWGGVWQSADYMHFSKPGN
jgi:hypothetical protein